MHKFKKIVLNNKILAPIALTIKALVNEIQLYVKTKRMLNYAFNNMGHKKIYYLGIPAHANLGDLAQGVCVRKWLKKNYPERVIVEIETNALVNTHFSLLRLLQKSYNPNDFIVFQSGYTTTDLGGFADEMHRAVMAILPYAKMLMLPQTIYFVKEENKKRTSACYNSMKKMLFLARDQVSYEMALNMFADIPVIQFPDIVTTLIGNYTFNYERDGILFCCRNDTEKYYSNEEIRSLMIECSKLCKTEKTDTTKQGKTKEIVANAEKYIYREIDSYAHYKLIVTDRYHGTILSLVSGTPVIVIKTTDHKVTTGTEWFKGIYDDYIYLADSLSDAYTIAKKVLNKSFDYKLKPHFEKEYYDKLPKLFESTIEKT